MSINNKNISLFSAKLMNRVISNSSIENIIGWNGTSLNPYFLSEKAKFKTLSITLDIICKSHKDLEIIKSNLAKEFTNEVVIKFDDIDFIYRGYLNTNASYKYIFKGNETVDLEFLVIAEKDYVAETVNRVLTKTISNLGVTDSPAIVEITPSIALVDLTIRGLDEDPIIIKNLEANKKIILDGEKSKITVNGANKFKDTDMWSFPRLIPGFNVITVDKNSCDITIKYKPRFL